MNRYAIVIAMCLGAIAGCRTQHNAEFDEAIGLAMNRHFYCLTFSDVLAECAVANGDQLPVSMAALVAWHNKRYPDVTWEATGLSRDCDVLWGTDVRPLTGESSWENPPNIIQFRSDYFREKQEFANQRFIGGLVGYRRIANNQIQNIGTNAPNSDL